MCKCRLCKEKILVAPSLKLSPFPKAAQYYPTVEEFKEDIGITLEVYQCPFCNLLQLCSEPVNYYKEVITAASFSDEAKKSRFNEFKNFVDNYKLNNKTAIEIGCGKGLMIDILNDAGLQTCGLEYSEEFVNYGKSLNRDIIKGYIYELEPYYDNKYDVFISLNYIEHQPYTNEFIKTLFRITKDDAYGYITAPNVDYLLRTHTLYEFVADHLIYFTKETMIRAFEMNGFDVLESNIINNDNDIALIVKKRKIKKIDGLTTVNSLIYNFKNLITKLKKEGKKVAVWGAGHRTLALLSISEVKEIDYIIDSADFKQGKYSPITHFKIIPPSEVEELKIDVIFVMLPGIYPQEVIKTIKTFKYHIEIY